MILLPNNDPAAAPVGLPKISGHSLLIDFSRSDVLDQSGSGNNLTRNGSAAVLGTAGGRQVKTVAGSAASGAGLRGSTTAIIPNAGFVTVWAWIYLTDYGVRRIAGRGQDGSGNGWGLNLETSGGGLIASIVTANPSAAQFSATIANGTLPLRRWCFVAGISQNQYGAEPSHISAYADGGKPRSARTGLGGWSELRTSTVGFWIDDGPGSGSTYTTQSGIGAVGVESNASLTEAQAWTRLGEIQRLTAPFFIRAQDAALYDPSDQQVFSGTGSASIQKLAASSAGVRGVTGAAAATVHALDAAGSGDRGQVGTGAASLQKVSAAASADTGVVGAGLATLQPITVTGAGVHGVVGAAAAQVGPLGASAAGDFTFSGVPEGEGVATLHALTARGVGEHDPGTTDVGGFARPFPGRPGQGISRAIADDRDLLEMLPIVIGVMNHAGR